MQNSIFVVSPYRFNTTWVFDDKQLGLTREPFVSGIPLMIDKLVEKIQNPEDGFKLFFSQQPFPGFQAELLWMNEEYGGNWYEWQAESLKGWLCPALLQYFTEAPKHIYCQAESK